MPTPVPIEDLPPDLRPHSGVAVPQSDLPEDLRFAPTSADVMHRGGMTHPVGGTHQVVQSVLGIPEAAITALESTYGLPAAALAREASRLWPGADPDKVHQAVQDFFVHQYQNPAAQTLLGAASAPAGLVNNLVDRGISALPTEAQPAAQGLKGAASDMMALGPLHPLANAGLDAMRAAQQPVEPVPNSTAAGFRTPAEHPVAAAFAGASGRDALNNVNQAIGNLLGLNESGIKGAFHPDDQVRTGQFAAGREAPNAVYNRWAAALPSNMTIDPESEAGVAIRGLMPGTNRITTGTPAVRDQTSQTVQELLNHPGFNGDRLLNEIRALRQEGIAGSASDDVDAQQLAKVKMNAADALEKFGTRQLPDYAGVTSDQLDQARISLAKNHAVEESMQGSNIDMSKLARMQRNNPGLLTGGLAAIGDFANNNPALAGLAQRNYLPASWATDILGRSAYQSGRNTEDALTIPSLFLGALGMRAAGRRFLTGNPDDALAQAGRFAPPRNNSLFGELRYDAPPTTGPQNPPRLPAPAAVPTGSGPVATESQLSDIGLTPDVRAAQQAHPGVADPNPPVPPAPRDMPLANFTPPQNWSGESQHVFVTPDGSASAPGGPLLAPNGAPGQGNLFDDFINFRDGPNTAGGLRFSPSSPGGPGDLGSVMSQGVPEGIVQRSQYPSVHWPLDQELDFAPNQTPRQFAAPHSGPATEGPESTLGDHFMTAPQGNAQPPPQQTVYRGVQPGVDPTAPRNRAGALFYTPDQAEAETYGSLLHEAQPTDIHDAGGIHDFLQENGVDPSRAGHQDALMEAAANYRAKPGSKQWVKFTYPLEGNPAEYIHLPSLPPDTSLGNALTGPSQ